MAVIGLVGGISDGFLSVLKLFSGYISDRFHRKRPFIFWGYTISAISKFMLLFANTWLFILFQRMLDRIGKGARDAPRDAYISVLTKSHRGRIFSIHKFMDNLGATIGTIIAIVILYFFEYDYLLVFAAAIVFALIGLVPLLL
jgi:MFS family permease